MEGYGVRYARKRHTQKNSSDDVKVQVVFPDELPYAQDRTYTYEAPDDTKVGEILRVPVETFKSVRVVALGSDYDEPCKEAHR